ncbi:uncharacterized protein LOC119866157 isoform X2 [Canis lupus familiaris]|uniref:uncharacterized protein LOC112676603 isoform X2 n=1 Tax=Canis lupus dingo TaxID=286419 RepID=UPI0015F19958|nr:uncharacterized protein LOC112676603 isoform X2 [Canis lupus dingo]XP_038292729.1 uncharacterized protein LOC119866157 isoform X2 [Canis lupus familiaris]XP_038431130.1 uncharacterized protein LOC119866157 isoform X2 [Canis lupus familiaris]
MQLVPSLCRRGRGAAGGGVGIEGGFLQRAITAAGPAPGQTLNFVFCLAITIRIIFGLPGGHGLQSAPRRMRSRAFARSWKRAGCSCETYCVDAPGGAAEGRAGPARERASERAPARARPGALSTAASTPTPHPHSGPPRAGFLAFGGDPDRRVQKRRPQTPSCHAHTHPENPGVKLRLDKTSSGEEGRAGFAAAKREAHLQTLSC